MAIRLKPTLTSLACVSLLGAAACSDDGSVDGGEGADEIGTEESSSTTDAGSESESASGSAESSSESSSEESESSSEVDSGVTDDPMESSSESAEDTTTDTTETGEPCGPECCPGEHTCEGEVSLTCNEDGTEWEQDEVCDSLQGVVCSEDSGLCEGACSESALGQSYIGCDYYPTVTPQYDPYNDAPKDEFAVAVANTGAEDAIILVTQGDDTVYDTVVSAGSVEVITLPWVNAMTKGSGPSALIVDGAYRLRSDRPIVVYQYNPLDSTTTNDASLMLPVNVWGKETMVASWPHWSSIPAFYTVVAHEDNTTVTLTPPPGGVAVSAGGGVASDGSGQIVLDNSDAINVITSTTNADLTGSLVVADKPVQVIGGHKCTNVPANITACDHLEEALFPIETLADEYIVVPPAQVPNDNLDKAQMVRVIATEDDTTLTFEPDQGVSTNLASAGDFVQLSSTTAAFKVTGDKPIMVVQYMVGQSAGYGTSDPAMVQAVTPGQFRTDYLFFAAPSWTANYVDIIAPTDASVTVDGAAVADWSAVGTSGYSVAHVELSNAGDGTHSVSADDKVGISVYGVQSAGSYWYPGGLELLQLNPQ
ncbi:IgGFc-binding protein [Pseudenhygromyxa sp. WMMC2535]|uniref:IgGFc-binding protein n=1 Tax=Pseudenhygromyxa sp. WMMC2535 TaxID=2712867 RepID=UPI00155405CC|nr:IgGFc-binding protein [Pseudenhygromyxa sp. WMMC2535]NVB40255.1 IgGFc-binding protein [Pseudenhygromyxa sp. WMMC2535]